MSAHETITGPVQITSYDGERIWVGETDTCTHCLLNIRRHDDGYRLPNGDPSFIWADDDPAGTINCPPERVGWQDRLHEPIGSFFAPGE